MKTLFTPFLTVLLLSCALRQSVSAATNGFIVPFSRTVPGSTHGYWERFKTPYGFPGNPADAAGSTSAATLSQVGSPDSFITGSGNIYDFSESLQVFEILDTTPFIIGSVVLQTRTLGSEIDYQSVVLTAQTPLGLTSLSPLFRIELDRGTVLGASVSSLWQWDLRGLNAQSYAVRFSGAGPSVSFDSMTLDVWSGFEVVPEPSGWALCSAAIAMCVWLHRQRHPSSSQNSRFADRA